MKHLILLMAVLCCNMASYSQNITGLWKGTLKNDSTHDVLNYEVYITRNKGKYIGYSHTAFLINGKTYYGVKKLKVSIARDGKIITQDDELLENDYPVQISRNVRQLNVLDFSPSADGEALHGPFVTNRTREFNELTGNIRVKKVSTVSASDLMQYLRKYDTGNSLFASN